MTAPPSALRAARGAQGWSQTDAARALAELARIRGVDVASPASLKTQLSRWENGHAAPEAPYRALLAELYADSGVHLAPKDPGPAATPGPVERMQARLAAAAAVDTEVIALWRTQLATAQLLDDRLGAAGAASAVRALLEQLDAVLPHLPDPDRHRPVAALLARACLLAGAQALDEGDPDSAFGGSSGPPSWPRRRPTSLRRRRSARRRRCSRSARRATRSRSWSTRAWTSPTRRPGSRWSSSRTGPTIRHLTRSSTWPQPWSARDPPGNGPRCTPNSPAPSTRPVAATRPPPTPGQARMLATRIGSRRVLRRLDGQGPSAGSVGSAVSSSASAAP